MFSYQWHTVATMGQAIMMSPSHCILYCLDNGQHQHAYTVTQGKKYFNHLIEYFYNLIVHVENKTISRT